MTEEFKSQCDLIISLERYHLICHTMEAHTRFEQLAPANIKANTCDNTLSSLDTLIYYMEYY